MEDQQKKGGKIKPSKFSKKNLKSDETTTTIAPGPLFEFFPVIIDSFEAPI